MATQSSVSNIPDLLKQQYDLDELHIHESPDKRLVVFHVKYLGEDRGFAINAMELNDMGEVSGTAAISNLIQKTIETINKEVIDLRQNALEGLSDVKILVDRVEEQHPGNQYPIVVTPEQADYLLATSDVRDYIINDPANALLFGHPFRVKAVRNA